MDAATNKPTTLRQSSDFSVASSTSSKRSIRVAASSFRVALKKPFRGWTKEALWAKSSLDDVYNFPSVRRRGAGEEATEGLEH
ncbi:hypothetical protein PMIN04_004052 [Paraphaeosphaeria minitans]